MLTRRLTTATLSFLLVIGFLCGFGAATEAASHRDWQMATLVAAERRDDAPQMERKKETKNSTDVFGNDQTTTTTTVQPNGLQQLWMYYTIQSAKTVYVTRVGVNLPWTKKIKAEAGSTIKYAVDGKRLYVLNEDGSEAKTEIMATRMAPLAPATKQPETQQQPH